MPGFDGIDGRSQDAPTPDGASTAAAIHGSNGSATLALTPDQAAPSAKFSAPVGHGQVLRHEC